MTDKCKMCDGKGFEPGLLTCAFCDSTGIAKGLAAATADAINNGTGAMLVSAEGVKHVPLADILVDLKPFRLLPYGTRFRYQGTPDVWVRTSHNVIAEWPGRLRTPANEPIQSLCCFCHLDGDEDGNTLDTLVEVVDQSAAPVPPQADAQPVAGQSRFTSQKDWQPCSYEHHLMVIANPSEWPGYETRALYTHADGGEVGHWKGKDDRHNIALHRQADDNRTLRALLAEALPGLDLAAGAFKSAKPVRNKVRDALSATASPATINQQGEGE